MPAASRRGNCFDPLRLIFAGMVLWTHAGLIGGFGPDWFSAHSREFGFGAFGVMGFFAISGYLIVLSLKRSPSPGHFLRKRVLRIFPAFYANLIFCAVILGPVIFRFENGTWHGYQWLGRTGALAYIGANAALKINRWTIGSLPQIDAINGSLWSLALEFVCYLGVLLLGLGGILSDKRVYLPVLFGGLVGAAAIKWCLGGSPYPLLPTFIALEPIEYPVAFGVGVVMAVFSDVLTPDPRVGWLFAGLLAGLWKFGGWNIAAPVVWPICLLNLAQCYSLKLKNDFSYGIYIYHFPVAKALALIPWFRLTSSRFVGSVAVLTLPFALLSWFLIERPCLGRKSAPETAG